MNKREQLEANLRQLQLRFETEVTKRDIIRRQIRFAELALEVYDKKKEPLLPKGQVPLFNHAL